MKGAALERARDSRLMLSALAALALAGCTTVGPDYHLPDGALAKADAAQAPFREAQAGAASAEALPARWWRLYDDPVLDQLEERALAANTDLRVAGANLARASAAKAIAEGEAEPDVGIDAGAERARLSGESYLLSSAVPPATLGNVGIQMSYQLDLFGRIRRSVEAAHADEQAVEATREAVRVTVAAQVARAYVSLCGANEALDLAGSAVDLRQRRLAISQRFFSAGRGSAIDVTEAQAQLAQASALLPAHRAEERAALYQLAALVGRLPAQAPQEAEACHHIPTLQQPLPVGDGAALLRRRPDLRVAERQLAAATARIGVATAELYPSVNFGLGAGSVGFLSDLGQAATNSWSIGSLIHWTYPGKAARARVRAENAGADAALARFDGTVLTALRETETALAFSIQDQNRAELTATALHEAELSADQARRLREGGSSPLLAEVSGQQGVLAARLSDRTARADLANDQIALFLALGGGW